MKFRGLHVVLLTVALQLAPQICGAYETDQFTNRLSPLADSTELLNGPVNQAISEAVANSNATRNDWKVVTSIYNDIGGHHWVDKIERWAMNSEEVERLQPSRRESIYQGHPIWATRVAAVFGVGPTIKLNGVLVGSDKLGHFLSQGRKFYRRYLNTWMNRKPLNIPPTLNGPCLARGPRGFIQTLTSLPITRASVFIAACLRTTSSPASPRYWPGRIMAG